MEAGRRSVSPGRANPFTPRARDAETELLQQQRADGVTKTLCELNGLLIGTEHAATMPLPAAAWLPSLAGGPSAGFGIEMQPAAPGPTARHDATARASSGFLDNVVSKLRSAISIDPPPADVVVPPGDARLIAFAWQPDAMTHAPLLTGRPRLLGAGALPDDSIALYDAGEQRWSAHRLVNLQQKRLAALAWQPQSSSVLAAACAKGVCLWRLAHTAEGALAGAHLQRVIDFPCDLGGLMHPPRLLAWHPLGKWLAAGSPRHAQLTLCDPAAASPAAHLATGATSALGGRAKVLHVLTGLPAVGIGVLEVAPCGGLLAGAGAGGGLRVWETRQWTWQSRPSLGHGAPCVAAAWQGPPPLTEGPRTLLLALRGAPCLHVLRFGKQRVLMADGAQAEAARSEYLGQVDLAILGGSPRLQVPLDGMGAPDLP